MDEYSHRSQGELAFFCPLPLFLWEYYKQSSDPCSEFEVSSTSPTLCTYSFPYPNFCSHIHTSTTAKSDATPTGTVTSYNGCAPCLDENSRDTSSCSTNKRPSKLNCHRRYRDPESDDDNKNRYHIHQSAISRHEPPSAVSGCRGSFIPAEWSIALACMEAANEPAQASTARTLSQRSDFSMDE